MKKIMLAAMLAALAFAMAACGGGNGGYIAIEVPGTGEIITIEQPAATIPVPADIMPQPEFEEEDVAVDINLNLPLVVHEVTYYGGLRITLDGELQSASRALEDWETIDTNVRSLATARGTTFFIKYDNSLWGFGSNAQGILGDGTGVDRNEPIHIMDNVAVIHFTAESALASISRSVLTIKTDRTLWTWGNGNFSPVQIAEDVVRVVGMDSVLRTLFQSSTGYIYRIMGNGSTEPVLPMPIFDIFHGNWWTDYINWNRTLIRRHYDAPRLPLVLDREEEIATDVEKMFHAGANTFFVKLDGSLWGMGENSNGELGDGTRVPRPEPVRIAEDVIYASAHRFLQRDGSLWIWDGNDPTPRLEFENVALYLGRIQFNDGRTLLNPWGFNPIYLDNVKIPRTLTFN